MVPSERAGVRAGIRAGVGATLVVALLINVRQVLNRVKIPVCQVLMTTKQPIIPKGYNIYRT